jgi:hypothetical protein
VITQTELKEYLEYNKNTGIFHWKKNPISGKKRIGLVAGSNKGSGYIRIVINQEKYYAHRLAWLYVYGVWPEREIDHINNNTSDNSIKNLREASREGNTRNTSLSKNNTSGFKGVCRCSRTNKWRAQCWVNKKNYYLGSFKDIDKAVEAVKRFREINHGEFANHGE